LAFEEHKIVERFLDGISKLVSKVIPLNVKALTKIREFFQAFSLSLTAGEYSVELKIERGSTNYQKTIREAIEGLENLLTKYKKKAVFFVDEMQDILENNICGEVEAALRFYAQKSKNIAFVFSGSNRRLLKEIFDDRKRPLYKICDRLNLKRIDKEHYIKFINSAATKRWKRKLSIPTLEAILNITEQHPYYVNYLCSNLWRLDNSPDENQVLNTWKKMCEGEANNMAMDIDILTINQKKLMEYVAEIELLVNPGAQEHLLKLRITARGIQQSIKGLLEKDFIEEYNGGLRVLDPMLKYILRR